MAGSVAHAFPVPAPPALPSSHLIEVRGFCGLGWHRGPDGACYRNGVPYGYAPYVYVSPYSYGARCWWTPTAFGPRSVCAW
jgi:hypothetical protein